MKTIIVVAGPTASGKTKFAIEIAGEFGGEIVSCDSMQLYKHMNIGSAKPTPEEMAAAPHFLVDEIEPSEAFSVARYQQMAKTAISDIFSRGKTPIIEGGTGLYLNSILYDMDFSCAPQDLKLRDSLEKEGQTYGGEYLHNKLAALDKEAADRIHPNNIKKIIRAIEGALSGNKIVDFSDCTKKTEDYRAVLIGITRNRRELYERINERVDIMVDAGLFDEVSHLLSMGLTEDDISMKGIGYKEIIGFFKGLYSKDEAVDLIKKNTRHLAKRQITWFKRYEDLKWFNISDYTNDEEAIGDMIKWLKKELKVTTKATNPTT